MKNVLALGVLPLISLAGASPLAPRDDPIVYDAIIIGGGPSGLSALSGLARVRRSALLIDSGEYRNGPTRHMHDVIGFDGKFQLPTRQIPSSLTESHRCHARVLSLCGARANFAL